MEEETNEVWAQNCYEAFEEAVVKGHYALALDCIGDMSDLFPSKAAEMRKELNEASLENFIHPSPLYEL